jgi:hypothetical protein
LWRLLRVHIPTCPRPTPFCSTPQFIPHTYMSHLYAPPRPTLDPRAAAGTARLMSHINQNLDNPLDLGLESRTAVMRIAHGLAPWHLAVGAAPSAAGTSPLTLQKAREALAQRTAAVGAAAETLASGRNGGTPLGPLGCIALHRLLVPTAPLAVYMRAFSQVCS